MSFTAVTEGLRMGANVLLTTQAPQGLGFTAEQISWPNTAFSPPNTAPYAEVTLITNPASSVTMGVGGEDEHTGVLQIGLYYPLEAGDAALLAAFEVFRTFFVAGVVLATGNVGARVESCSMSPPKKVGSRYVSYVSVYWVARTQRPANTLYNPLSLFVLLGSFDLFFTACNGLTSAINDLPNKLY